MLDDVRPWLSQEHFQAVVQRVQDHAMFLLDANGIVRTWNLGAERIKGYRADEIVGQHFGRLYTDEDVQRSKPDLVLRSAAEKGRFEEEGWRRRCDGGRFWASVAITALHDEHRCLTGFAKVTFDLGARRVASAESARTAEDDGSATSRTLDALLEHAQDPVVLTDLRGVAFAATAAAEQLLGVHGGFFARRPLINVVARQDTRSFRALLDALQRASSGAVHTQTLRMRPRQGEVFASDVRVARYQGPRGPALHWTLRVRPPFGVERLT